MQVAIGNNCAPQHSARSNGGRVDQSQGRGLNEPATTGAARSMARWSMATSMVIVAMLALGSAPARAADDDAFATNARLLASMRNDDGAGVSRALRDGAAVNSRNRLGESALLMALKKNRADLAQLVLDAGADVNEP